MIKTSALQQAIKTVENLPPDDQEILFNLLQKRQQEQRRANLLQEIKEIQQEYTKGNVQFGSLDQFLTQLDLPKIPQIPKDK